VSLATQLSQNQHKIFPGKVIVYIYIPESFVLPSVHKHFLSFQGIFCFDSVKTVSPVTQVFLQRFFSPIFSRPTCSCCRSPFSERKHFLWFRTLACRRLQRGACKTKVYSAASSFSHQSAPIRMSAKRKRINWAWSHRTDWNNISDHIRGKIINISTEMSHLHVQKIYFASLKLALWSRLACFTALNSPPFTQH